MVLLKNSENYKKSPNIFPSSPTIRMKALINSLENNMKKHIVSRILPGSIAEEMGFEPGDAIVKINNEVRQIVLSYF